MLPRLCFHLMFSTLCSGLAFSFSPGVGAEGIMLKQIK